MGADQYFECVKSVRLDLLEIFGREYVVEHCISAFKILQEEKVFKIYVTDSLKAMGEGKRLADRYADIIIPEGGQNLVALEMLIGRIRAHINS